MLQKEISTCPHKELNPSTSSSDSFCGFRDKAIKVTTSAAACRLKNCSANLGLPNGQSFHLAICIGFSLHESWRALLNEKRRHTEPYFLGFSMLRLHLKYNHKETIPEIFLMLFYCTLRLLSLGKKKDGRGERHDKLKAMPNKWNAVVCRNTWPVHTM